MLQSGGLFIVLKLQQYSAKYAMQQKINTAKTNFEYLTLSQNDFQKYRIEKKELFYQSKLYDIKSIEVCNDSVKLSLIRDSEEENVFKKIKKLFATDQNHSKKLPDMLIQLLHLDYVSHTCITVPHRIHFSITRNQGYNASLLTPVSDILLPPPESV